MFYSLKKNYKVLLIASCIFLVLGIYQHKKANEIDLTKLTDLQQICEVLNLPIGVVCPDGATEHDFSAEIHQGRGLYTVAFQPYKHTKADYGGSFYLWQNSNK